MIQSKGMSKFMCHDMFVFRRSKNPCRGRHQGESTGFAPAASNPRYTQTILPNCILTIVNDNEINVPTEIKCRSNLLKHGSSCILKIVAFGVLAINMMHQRLVLGIGLDAEGPVAVAVRLHLLAIEGLTLLDHRLHRIHHLGAVRPVVGQEVDHPHRARLSHVQVRQPLAGRPGVIAPPLLVVEGNTEMHAVGRRRRRMGHLRGRGQEAGQPRHRGKDKGFHGRAYSSVCPSRRR